MAEGRSPARPKDTDFSKVQIKVTKVSGNIYMLHGDGGNTAASVGDDGIVIVDDQFAPLAEKIRAALKGLGISDKPVRFAVNTHYHGDHTGGNAPGCNWRNDRDRTRERAEAIGNRRIGREWWLRENTGSACTTKRLASDYVLRTTCRCT
jgi:glyoxylase-like metal-dependent hydrolase (beta-lactamase superfamily II)